MIADAQADLSLRWAHSHFVLVMRHPSSPSLFDLRFYGPVHAIIVVSSRSVNLLTVHGQV